MIAVEYGGQLAELREAFGRGNLTLYLGAGVSRGNGLPTWENLVLTMYFSAINRQPMEGWRPFSNYLYAIAEWHLRRGREPLEVTARRIRKYYQNNPGKFLANLRERLYGEYLESGLHRSRLRSANQTLDAVARLCETGDAVTRGVRSVITYNYDELLEKSLRGRPFQSFWKPGLPPKPGRLPIYHVHGFVPLDAGEGSAPGEILFTEEQYNLAAHDAYSWSNLVQLQSMSGSVGLMVGLSLSDRNMRRLLDAITKLPHHPKHYALLQRPSWDETTDEEVDEIHERAKDYREKFKRSGVKGTGEKGAGEKGEQRRRQQIRAIIGEVERLDVEQQTYVLRQLGIEPIWYDEHEEIKAVVEEILRE